MAKKHTAKNSAEAQYCAAELYRGMQLNRYKDAASIKAALVLAFKTGYLARTTDFITQIRAQAKVESP